MTHIPSPFIDVRFLIIPPVDTLEMIPIVIVGMPEIEPVPFFRWYEL